MKFTFPPNSTPLAGYTIKRGIHRGGFGEVYYARTDAGKEVALKLLQSQLEVELRGVRQCLNLKHPNLVGLYDIRIDDDGDHWIVMEYVSGRNLADVLDDHPDGLPLEDVSPWIEGMAAGLDFLHDRGIVHRDLKPGNVFVENGLVKIGDVGLSKYISQSRRNEQTQSVGTVYYMAPEVAHGRYGREVDVYSLGIVLYELLTGRVPFEGESTAEILMKHLTEEPDLETVEARFRPILAKALEKDPAKRTATAGEVAEAFAKAVSRSRRRSSRRIPVGAVASDGPSTFVRTAPPETSFVHTDADPIDELETHFETPDAFSSNARPQRPKFETSSDRDGWDRFLFGFLWHRPGKAESRSTRPSLSERHPWWPLGFAGLLWGVVLAPHVVVPVALAVFVAWIGYTAFAGGSPPASGHHRSTCRTTLSNPILMQPARASELLSPETRRRIPIRRRIAEASAALAYATPLTVIVTACVFLASPLLPLGSTGSTLDAGLIGLFPLVTLLGSWAILAASKFVEGRRVNGLHRRLAYFIVGSLVGVAAFWLHGTLLVELDDGFFRRHDSALFERLPNRPLADAFRQPTMHAYMLFFGLLFAMRRWWWHVDGFRPWRFRVWTVGVTTVVGFLLCSVFQFPHVWGALWAASICTVSQLAAAWMPPEERYQLVTERPHV